MVDCLAFRFFFLIFIFFLTSEKNALSLMGWGLGLESMDSNRDTEGVSVWSTLHRAWYDVTGSHSGTGKRHEIVSLLGKNFVAFLNNSNRIQYNNRISLSC